MHVLFVVMTFVCLHNTKGQIYPQYGVNFAKVGYLEHSLNKYYLIVGWELPTYKNIEIKNLTLNCSNFPESIILQDICKTFQPILGEIANKEAMYKQKLNDIMHKELEVIVPNYKNKRPKRFVNLLSQVAGMVFQGLSDRSRKRDVKSLKRGIQILNDQAKINRKKIISLKQDMRTVATAQADTIKHIQSQISSTNLVLKDLTLKVGEIVRNVSYITEYSKNNRKAIMLLTHLTSQIYALTLNKLSHYESLVKELDKMLIGIDNLSSGKISTQLLSASKLREFLDHIEEELGENYPEYKLLFENLYQYYDFSMSYFEFRDNRIVISIPIYIQHFMQETLTIYSLDTVPVPYNMGGVDGNAYTWLRPKERYLAINKAMFTEFSDRQLAKCRKLGLTYFCEESLLLTHRGKPDCFVSIFDKVTDIDTLNQCDFEYYQYLDPAPKIIDSGNDILLSNLDGPWMLYCNQYRELPLELAHSKYAIIKKDQLCKCDLSLGKYFIHENLLRCNHSEEKLKLYKTINMGVAMKLLSASQFKTLNFNNQSIYESNDFVETFETLDVVSYGNQEILDQNIKGKPIDLGLVIKNIKEGRKVFQEEGDWLIAQNKFENWFSSNDFGKGMNFIFGIIGTLGFLIAIKLICSHFRIRALMENILIGAAAQEIPLVEGWMVEKVNGDYHHNLTIGDCAKIIMLQALAMIVIYVIWKMYIWINRNWGNSIKEMSVSRRDVKIYLNLYNNMGKSCHLLVFQKFGDISDIHKLSINQYLDISRLTLKQNWIFDIVNLNWEGVTLSDADKSVSLPVAVQVPLMVKVTLRQLIKSPEKVEINMVASVGHHWSIIRLHRVMVDQGTFCTGDDAEAICSTESLT